MISNVTMLLPCTWSAYPHGNERIKVLFCSEDVFSLPQLFVFLSDVFSDAVFAIRDRFVNHTNYVITDFKCHDVTALYLACMPAWQ